MKKLVFFLMLLALGFTSCESEEVDHGCKSDQIYVEAYIKMDGTHVNGYCRAAHNK